MSTRMAKGRQSRATPAVADSPPQSAAPAHSQPKPASDAVAPQQPKPIRDDKGHVVRLGEMQQWVVDCLGESGATSKDVAAAMGEDESRAITRLRQLAVKGVVVFDEENRRWSRPEGPAVPRSPLPRLRRS